MQRPSAHVPEHVTPQAPQLLTSPLGLMHAPLHSISADGQTFGPNCPPAIPPSGSTPCCCWGDTASPRSWSSLLLPHAAKANAPATRDPTSTRSTTPMRRELCSDRAHSLSPVG